MDFSKTFTRFANLQASLPHVQHGCHGLIIGYASEFVGTCSHIHTVKMCIKLCDYEAANCYKEKSHSPAMFINKPRGQNVQAYSLDIFRF